MSNEKQLIRWERHYSDGSVEYTDKESTKNFEDNLSSVGGLIASRSYIQMKPVEWQESKAENSPISDVRLSLPSIEEIETLERSIVSADPTLADVCIKDLREQIFTISKKLKLAISNEA